MPIHQHHKIDGKAFNSGANRDFDEEFLGELGEGEYLDARNMHPTRVGGDTLALSSISGDTNLYPLTNNACDPIAFGLAPTFGLYECQCIMEVNDDIFDVWVPPIVTAGTQDPSIMRVNGIIVCMTVDLPFRQTNPLQFHKNESCIGGEIYLTDKRTPPLVFNIQDMKDNGGMVDPDNICTDTYFGNFDISLYTININAPNNVPYFVGLVRVGPGLDTGEYQYSFRYVTLLGDRTEWTAYTPPIPVPYFAVDVDPLTNTRFNSQASLSTIYPNSKTFGFAPSWDVGNMLDPVPSIFAIKLKLRIDNRLDFEYIQIRRVDYNLGQFFMPPAATTIIAEIPIVPGQCDIIEYTDPDPRFATITVVIDEEEDLGLNRVIDYAKTLRYYNSRLYLMNIKEASKVVDNVTFNTSNLGAELQPIMHNTGTFGQYDPYNHTYYKPYLTGEKYGFAVVFYDSTNSPSFALPVPGTVSDSWVRDGTGAIVPNDFANYQMPNRRTVMPAASQTYSYDGFCTAASDQGTVDGVFEVFDHVNAVRKSRVCPFINIVRQNTNPNHIWMLGTASSLLGKAFLKLENSSNYGTFYNCTDLSRELRAHYHTVVGNIYVPIAWQANPWNIGFRTYRPWSLADMVTNSGTANSGTAGHDYAVNPMVGIGNNTLNKRRRDYNPRGHGMNYHMLGVAIDGLNTNSIPTWVSGFSVVRSETANRVLCQGLGYYSMTSANASLAGTQKWRRQIWFYSPDMDQDFGWINPQEVLQSVGQGGGGMGVLSPYKLQLNSPLGFFSEVYNFIFEGDINVFAANWNTWGQVDMITYCSILQDSGQINVSENSNMGISGNYVAFGKWRSSSPSSSDNGSFTTWHQGGTTGNTFTNVGVELTIFNIQEIIPVTSGDQSYWKITVDRNIYANQSNQDPLDSNWLAVDLTTGTGFDNSAFQDWCEPMYICSIIRPGVQVARGTVNTYYHTGTHINLRSVIARIDQDMVDNLTHYDFQLSDERIEDCAPHPSSTTVATDNRFVWVNGNAWLNVTNKTNAQISGYIASIGAVQGSTGLTVGTTSVFGLFTHTDDAVVSGSIAEGRNYTLHFQTPVIWNASPIFVWELIAGDVVEVRYDNSAPIRVWGGDSNVGDSIWAPIDLENERTHSFNDGTKYSPSADQHWWDNSLAGNVLPPGGQSSAKAFRMFGGFPYKFYDLNPRIYQCQLRNVLNRIQDQETVSTSRQTTMRQLVSKFTSESRVNTSFIYSANIDGSATGHQQHFPNVHYIPRPLEWNSDRTKWIHPSYLTRYPGEEFRWGKGGFRFRPLVNWDYSSRAEALMEFSRPTVGFRDESIFCTRIIWSEKREVNVQDSPGVKTFPVQNFYDISDNTGEIKFAWDALSDRGSNLYAVTDSGICMLITDKRTLSSVEGAEFTSIALEQPDMAVTDQFWINKTTGMSDEFWRSAAEFENSLYFANKSSVHLLMNNQVKDIGRVKYFSKIFPYVDLATDGYGTKMEGCYDTKHKEYWLNIHGVGSYSSGIVALVWSELVQHWVGEYDFDYTVHMSFNNRTYGSRDGDGLYQLHRDGVFTLGGTSIVSHVDQASSKQSAYGKEFFRFRINSNTSPSSVDFLQANAYPAVVVEGSVASGIMKSYDGFEQYIPRKTTDGFRNQGRLLIYRINHTFAGQRFIVKSAVINYKLLK